MLNHRSGIQLTLALRVIQIWIQSIPLDVVQRESENNPKKPKNRTNDEYENLWPGNIQETLGKRMKSS